MAGRDIVKAEVPEVASWDDSGTLNSEEWILIAHNRREIQQIMWDYVGIVRSDLRLGRALRRLELIQKEVEDFYKRTKVTEGLIELRNLALCAMLVITMRNATERKQGTSRHHRLPQSKRCGVPPRHHSSLTHYNSTTSGVDPEWSGLTLPPRMGIFFYATCHTFLFFATPSARKCSLP